MLAIMKEQMTGTIIGVMSSKEFLAGSPPGPSSEPPMLET